MTRRERASAELAEQTGITEAMIERLVRAFYAKVRADEVLAPVFDARIHDWEPHLAQMCAFWSSVALMTGRYHGTPMAKHMPLPVDAGHFDRWLSNRPRAKSVRRKPRSTSSRVHGGLPRASNSASRTPTASCSASVNGSGVSKKEQCHDLSTQGERTGLGRSLFRQQPGADVGCGSCPDAGRDDRCDPLDVKI